MNALLYLEYALEMGDLSMYFPEQQQFPNLQAVWGFIDDYGQWLYFGIGVFVGGAGMWGFRMKKKHRKRNDVFV